MKLISTSAVALSLLIATVPFAAFAEDSGTSTDGSGGEHVLMGNGGTSRPPFDGIRAGLNGMLPPNASLRAHMEAELSGSSSDSHMNLDASSTVNMPHEGKNRGEGNGMHARAHGDGEISSRIDNLNKMIARIAEAERLSPDAKVALTATLNAQIASLTGLKTQIDTEGTTTLKTDDQSIAKNFRIYALVMPQAAINAAADRIMMIASQMQTFSAKVGDRITAAQTAGVDVTAAVAAHTDFDAKVADAKVQAQAAVTEVAALKPDNGDATLLASNTATLKDAKSKIDAAQADLKAARKDIGTILSAIHGKGEVKATVTASTTAQ